MSHDTDMSPFGMKAVAGGNSERIEAEAKRLGIILNAPGSRYKDFLSKLDLFPRDILLLFEKKMKASQGQLIVASHKYYEEHGKDVVGRPLIVLKNILYFGQITSETCFLEWSELEAEEFPIKNRGGFVRNVSHSHHLNIESLSSRNLSLSECDSFAFPYSNNMFALLYFMSDPPVFGLGKRDHHDFLCFRERYYARLNDEPRFEIFVGDNDSLPVLEKSLEPWEFLGLSSLLDREIPESDSMKKRIERDQYETVLNIINAGRNHARITKRANRDISRAIGGIVLVGDNSFEPHDDVSMSFKYMDATNGVERNLKYCLSNALSKKYHERGRNLEIELAFGFSHRIDVKKFLEHAFSEFLEFMPSDYKLGK